MSATTIQIPAQHVEAIRRSLTDRRRDADSEEIEGLLRQLSGDSSADAELYELTGPPAVLWNAVYDALCAAAEQLADDCNEYWRGTVEADSARAGIAAVSTRLELLVALGTPPGG